MHTGTVLPPGQEGDIAIRVKPQRPVGLFQEYWKNPEETANSFRGEWYITGDRGLRDAEGYFWFVGRADDVIISAGYRIGPSRSSASSSTMPWPNRPSSPAPTKYVAPLSRRSSSWHRAISPPRAGGGTPGARQACYRPYKYPREIEFVTELPKTISGKIRRIELRSVKRR